MESMKPTATSNPLPILISQKQKNINIALSKINIFTSIISPFIAHKKGSRLGDVSETINQNFCDSLVDC